ncbi:MAG: hypothetical protein BWY21_01353 [Parcubacteria group bacterium ADurb.Bin216]|nr:MAG: hypothetical protein BWY21_01353 [Parcubacteria group bacterium ADurb.Bin216]
MRGFRKGEVRTAYKGRYHTDILRINDLLAAEKYLNTYTKKVLLKKFNIVAEFRL